jgi:hypothetical protein
MSTKTLRKRIALVAVAALGAGVLSVAPANAAAPDDLTAGDIITTSVAASTPGVCFVDTTTSSQDVVVVTGSSFKISPITSASAEYGYVALSGNLTITGNSGFDTATTTTAGSTSGVLQDADELTITAGAVGTGKITISSTDATAAVEAISVVIVAACAGSTFSPTYSFLAAITQFHFHITSYQNRLDPILFLFCGYKPLIRYRFRLV